MATNGTPTECGQYVEELAETFCKLTLGSKVFACNRGHKRVSGILFAWMLDFGLRQNSRYRRAHGVATIKRSMRIKSKFYSAGRMPILINCKILRNTSVLMLLKFRYPITGSEIFATTAVSHSFSKYYTTSHEFRN